MSEFVKTLYAAMKTSRKQKSERHFIVLKNRQCYENCLKQLKALGIRPLKKLPGINAICFHIPRGTELVRLKQDSFVKCIEKDVKVKLHQSSASSIDSQMIPWGIERIGATKVWGTTNGRRVKVAVLDTGINSHIDLKISGRHDIVNSSSEEDSNGHGTHVAGTIAALNNAYGVVGVAPRAALYSVKAFRKDGTANLSDILEGLVWCIRNGMQVINMSFGMTERSDTLHVMVKRAYKRGIVLVASAGNSGPNNKYLDYPAQFPETIGVVAVTKEDRIASFSNRGERVDVSAPGVGILSTAGKDRYNKLSGTSMAAAHVTGAAALLLSVQPSLTPDEVRRILCKTATPLNGYDTTEQGAGIIDLERAVGLLAT